MSDRVYKTFIWACLIGVVCLIAALTSPDARAHWNPGLHNRLHAIHLTWCGKPRTICPASREAVRVAKCESGWSLALYAENGQYKGMFQMGSSEREKYGHGIDPWSQAKAAHDYYLDSWWWPWECAGKIGLL
jgi:hypothetical protein